MRPDEYPKRLMVGVTSSRVVDVSPAARGVHRAILRAFAATGRAPAPASVAASVPDGRELAEVLVELHDHDVVRLDDRGNIRAAYPFSGVPTAHQVTIDGGPTAYAMCAIDALGIAAMLGRDLTITSVDPASGAEIRVSIRDGRARWQPITSVVLVGSYTARPGTVVAADLCCSVMNFFASRGAARKWIADHPQVTGMILAKERALRLGVDIFGHLLDD